MEQLLAKLAGHWVISLLSLIGTFLFGLLSLYLYLKSRRFKGLAFAVKGVSFVKDYQSKIPKLSVSYEGKQIQNLTVTKFVLWNRGTDTINYASDVAGLDRLRVEITEPFEILNVEILCASRDANQSFVDRRWLLFDFLDHNDGFIFQVTHTAPSENAVAIAGTVKGAKALREYNPRQPRETLFLVKIALAATLVFGVLGYLTGFFTGSSFIEGFVWVLLMFSAVALGLLFEAGGSLPKGLKRFHHSV